MKPGGFEQLLCDLRPEAALAAMLALGALVLLGGHLYLLRPSLAKFREVESKGPQATLEGRDRDPSPGALHALYLDSGSPRTRPRLATELAPASALKSRRSDLD